MDDSPTHAGRMSPTKTKLAIKLPEMGNDIPQLRDVSYLSMINLQLDSPRMKQAMQKLGVIARELKLL